MPDTEKRGRGRPRSFDPEEALGAASIVFQRKGYDAASLDDLAGATGLTRPSLYAAFGNKEALYLKALQEIARSMQAALDEIAGSDVSLEDALRAFYGAALDRYTAGPAGACGCLVMTTGVARAPESEAVRAYVATVLEGLDAAIAALYARKFSGEGSARTQKQLLAVSVLQTLSIRARAGTDRAALDQLVEEVLPTLL